MSRALCRESLADKIDPVLTIRRVTSLGNPWDKVVLRKKRSTSRLGESCALHHRLPANYYCWRMVLAASSPYAGIMPNDTMCAQDRADAGKVTVGQALNLPSRRFSCVYLTSSVRVAEMASALVDSVQIHVYRSTTLDGAEARLRVTNSRVLLTDISFERGGWEDALRMAARLPRRPVVVLVSRLADERLWIDALERGAYDLILEPFQADEMRRILENAHFHATSGESHHFPLPTSSRLSKVRARLPEKALLCSGY